MPQHAPGDGYYDRLKKEKRELANDMRANSDERRALREAFKTAAEDQKQAVQAKLDANEKTMEALFNKSEALDQKEMNPPWIKLSEALLYADYNKVEELSRDGTLIKLMNEELVPILGQPAYAGDDKIAKLMIERGAALETTGGEMRETALQTSIYKDNVGVFKMLVKAGANTAVLNAEGKNLRRMAEEYGATDILSELDKMDRKAKKKAAPKAAKPK